MILARESSRKVRRPIPTSYDKARASTHPQDNLHRCGNCGGWLYKDEPCHNCTDKEGQE